MVGRPSSTRFVHPALFYRSDDEYQATIVPFLTGGLALGQPVAVSVPGPRLRLLREALGAAARDVTLLDMTHEGRNPGRIIAGVLRRFADAHPDRHVRIVGEPIWQGRSDTEYPACVQHEALINAAFADRDVTILCPYDLTGLDDTAIADAYVTHPVVWDGNGGIPSDRYDPDDVLARYNQPLEVSVAESCQVTSAADVVGARRFAVEQGRRLGLGVQRLQDLALIATELATNSIVHTPGPGHLTVFFDGVHVVCEARDPGVLEPLAGRRPADPGNPNGRGLLLVNDLADLVRTHTGPDGTAIRAFLRV